jgi:hypothetical protein
MEMRVMGMSRRQFTKEFKEAAVRRLERRASGGEAARACAGSPNGLHRGAWRENRHRISAAKRLADFSRSEHRVETGALNLGGSGGNPRLQFHNAGQIWANDYDTTVVIDLSDVAAFRRLLY